MVGGLGSQGTEEARGGSCGARTGARHCHEEHGTTRVSRVLPAAQTYKSDIPIPIAHETNPFAWSIWGLPMCYMAGQALGYFCLAVLLDSGLLSSLLNRLARARSPAAPPPPQHRGRRRPGAAAGGGAGAEGDAGLTMALLEPGAGRRGPAGAAGRAPREEEGEEEEEDVDVAAEREAVQARVRHANSQVRPGSIVFAWQRGFGSLLQEPCVKRMMA